MKYQTVVFVSTIFWNYVSSQTCLTPMGDTSKCISIYKCNDLLRPLLQDPITNEVMIFLKQSQCGVESSGPLVCCGPLPSTQPELTCIFNIRNPDADSTTPRGFMIYNCDSNETNFTALRVPLYKIVNTGNYDVAIKMAQALHKSGNGGIITETVNKLIDDDSKNLMALSYKLWNGGYKHIISLYFPREFKLILNKSNIKLIFKYYGLAVKLAVEAIDNDKKCQGDAKDKSSTKVSWKFVPVCEDNEMFFKIIHTESNRYMKLEVAANGAGDRLAWGAIGSDNDRHLWYLNPVMSNGTLLFYIYNRQYNQALKLDSVVNEVGDRDLWGHNGAVAGSPEKFGWIIEMWDYE